VLIGTLRKDGSPRISSVEPDFVAGKLIARDDVESRKALDILRDPRLRGPQRPRDRMNSGGDVKIYGKGVDVSDEGLRRQYEETIFRPGRGA